MVPPQQKTRLTPAQYLERERKSPFRSEYYRGEVFAMSGGSRNHAKLCGNVYAALDHALRGSGCIVFPTDLRVHVPTTGLFTYPDVSVVCDEEELLDEQQDTLLNPTVLVEVLSPSTERYDRGAKFALYRSIPSLQAYVLVGQRERRIEVFQQGADGRWVLNDFGPDAESVETAPLGVQLPMEALYAHVTLDEEPPLR